MTPGPTDADLAQIIRTLDRHGVKYVIVGGMAAWVHGAQRPTRDVDVVASSGTDNLARLGAALRELKAQIRGAPPLPEAVMAAQLHPAALANRQFGNWTTEAGELDTALFIGSREDQLDYESLLGHAVRTELQGVPLVIASLSDIITAKEPPTETRIAKPSPSCGASTRPSSTELCRR